jgi:hypothetical protein
MALLRALWQTSAAAKDVRMASLSLSELWGVLPSVVYITLTAGESCGGYTFPIVRTCRQSQWSRLSSGSVESPVKGRRERARLCRDHCPLIRQRTVMRASPCTALRVVLRAWCLQLYVDIL